MQKLELQSSAATDRLSRSAYCEKHGEYVEAGRKVFGHIVWFGCAKCQEEERKHQEMLQKLEEARGRAWSYRQLFGEWLPKAFDFPLESFEVLDAAMGTSTAWPRNTCATFIATEAKDAVCFSRARPVPARPSSLAACSSRYSRTLSAATSR